MTDWLAIAGIVFGIAALWYAARNESVAQNPSQRGMFVGIGLALLGSTAWFSFQRTMPKFNPDTLFAVGAIVLSVPLYVLILGFPFVRRGAGELLRGFPRFRVRAVSGLATSALFLLLLSFRLLQEGFTKGTIPELLFYLAVILYFGLPVFGKVEVHKEGILESYELYRWPNIASYKWTGLAENDLALTLKRGRKKNATISFRPDETGVVEGYLREHAAAILPKKEGS